MTESEHSASASPRKSRSIASLRPLLPALGAACALLALWLGWSAWQQYRSDNLEAALLNARDGVVKTTADAVTRERDHLSAKLASAPVQEALVAGDLAVAAQQIAANWTGVEQVEVLPVDLDAAYAALPKTGYGKLGVAEASVAGDKPAAWIVRDAGGARLALSAPAKVGATLVGVAYARLPLARATAAIEASNIGDDSYLALRQGSHSVVERGDSSLGTGAEVLATAVPGTDWRVAAALPDITGAPFGLSALLCAIAAVVFALLALFAFRTSRKLQPVGPEATVHEASPTLAQALEQEPSAPPAPKVKDIPAPPQAPGPVLIDRSIFRAYDIRGVVGQTLDMGVAELIGQSVGSLMADKGLTDIAVGRDGRLSGPDMVAGLIEGLRKAGRNVIDIGMAPTPVVYFAGFHLRTGSCVSVTGSHNPPDYNGFKIVVGGETLSGDAITDLYARIAEDRLHEASTPGNWQHRDVSDDYIQRIASDVQIDRPLKVVVDAGNGVAGAIAPQVLSTIGAEVTPLHCDVDGTFPNHHPDPSDPRNLEDLVRMVQRLDADLGVAFDGDGDRLGVVTRDGKNIFADRLLMLFAADVLERNPGAVIVYDVKCTGRLPGQILRHGGSPLMWKTGHSLIKAKMRETDAELAGEMSGHFFFKERWYGFDDGIYAAARLLEILASKPQSPSEVLNALPDGVSTPEINIEAPEGDPHGFVERFRNTAKFEGARLSTIDGLRVDWPDGWGLVRASNTTPVLVLRFDADSRDGLLRIQEAFRTQLLAVRPDLKLPF
ncbi:phosphomannomutase/phosphoglucomutase [Lysobacter sp. CFH 32150]|uniref:phosphomannomutase/phosphoglucomutase n=1 Tax=Lysobacter sp. CFH 32150 TaxID=2927128 RepID=UPI001FA74DF4|nr:phosphomannomutase/phosphoglucomutase [Lysobacter sp. CFH 32150]MCI4569062.1 phosphomannomutase/phosphoglucomutase [Lysobacter sp. CFH 32150]